MSEEQRNGLRLAAAMLLTTAVILAVLLALLGVTVRIFKATDVYASLSAETPGLWDGSGTPGPAPGQLADVLAAHATAVAPPPTPAPWDVLLPPRRPAPSMATLLQRVER